MKKYVDQDDIPLNIVRRNLIRKQKVIESNKKYIKEKNSILKSNITNPIVNM